jgi:hypothetical protein
MCGAASGSARFGIVSDFLPHGSRPADCAAPAWGGHWPQIPEITEEPA